MDKSSAKKTAKPKKLTASEVTVSSGAMSAKSSSVWDMPKLRIVLAVIVVLALAVGGFFIYRHFMSNKEQPIDSGFQENVNQIIESRPADNAPAEERANYFATLGAAYDSAGKRAESIDAFRKAEALFTQPADLYGIWYNLAGAYEAQGDKKQALAYYQKALDFAKHPPDGETADSEQVNDLSKKIEQLGG